MLFVFNFIAILATFLHCIHATGRQEYSSEMPSILTITPPFALLDHDKTVTFNCSAAAVGPAIDYNRVTVQCNRRPLPISCQASYALYYSSHTCSTSLLESADCLCVSSGDPSGNSADVKAAVSHDAAMYIASAPQSPRLAACEWNESLAMGSPFVCELWPGLLELESRSELPLRAAELSLNVSFSHWANGYTWQQCDMSGASAAPSILNRCPTGQSLCCDCDSAAAAAASAKPQRCVWLAADFEEFANDTLLVRLGVCNRLGWCSSKQLVLDRSDYKRPLPLLLRNVTFAVSPTGDSVLAWLLPLPQLHHLTSAFDTEVSMTAGSHLLARNSTRTVSAPLSLAVPPLATLQFCARRRPVNGRHWSQPTCLTARSPPAPLLCPPAQSFVDATWRYLWIGMSELGCVSHSAEAAAASAAANLSACSPPLPESSDLVQCRCERWPGYLQRHPATAACRQRQSEGSVAPRPVSSL
ncbi:hypothetical protein BOX15_Mlig033348g1 [Macrostomum lignano]|uniref:Ig-like domain-containing protein n=1 Tax=Macrostomum lignano TaxID=282301 RepID=A0A267F4Y2_9PLAT|nr:hypothetical protein BOX15_Mlig033348g1 [Macrostomum lignano]